MKDKHLKIKEDQDLLKTIQQTIAKEFNADTKGIRSYIIWKFVFYFLLTALLYFSLFQIENTFLFTLAFVGYGLSALLLAFNFAHDFSHDTVFKEKRWNKLGFIAIFTIVGAHAEAWKERHIHSHHFAPNVKDYDSDLQITGIIRVIPESEHHWYHRFQHLYAPIAYTSYSLFWIFIKDFVIYTTEEGLQKKTFSYHLSFWLQKLIYFTYLLVLPLLFAQQAWYIVLFSFFVMHLVQSLFLLFTFFMTHHVESTYYPKTDEEGIIRSSWIMNQIKSSNDMHPFSPLANFILGGFNNHIAHHLFPQIHHIHYPKLNRILYKILKKHGIQPNYTSYWGGIRSHLRLLKQMGRI